MFALATVYIGLLIINLVIFCVKTNCHASCSNENAVARFSSATSTDTEPPSARFVSRTKAFSQLITVIAPVLIGLGMFAFFMGAAKFRIGDSIGLSAEIFGSLSATITLLPMSVVSRRFKQPLQTVFYKLMLPCVAVALIAVIALSGEVTISRVSLGVGLMVYWFFSVSAFMALAIATVGASGREFSADLVVSTVFICFSALTMAGLLYGSHTGLAMSATPYMPASVIVLYCII